MADSPLSLPIGLSENVYYSPSDLTVSLVGHPDARLSGPLDAAYVRFSAGDPPIHIYNYARAGTVLPGGGTQGGAPFDDTALGNRMVVLELVMNMDRFREVRSRFLPMTYVGDLLLTYDTVSWTDTAANGYYLRGGRVEQAGYDVNVRGATFPAIRIQFEDLDPYLDGQRVSLLGAADEGPTADDRARASAEAAADDRADGPASPDVSALRSGRHKVVAFDFAFTEGGSIRVYSPERFSATAQANHDRRRAGTAVPFESEWAPGLVRRAEITHDGDVFALRFQGAVLHVDDAHTLVWDPLSEGARTTYRVVEGVDPTVPLDAAAGAALAGVLLATGPAL